MLRSLGAEACLHQSTFACVILDEAYESESEALSLGGRSDTWVKVTKNSIHSFLRISPSKPPLPLSL